MKRYYLYLDESGDFESDAESRSYRNPSLVGGFLWNKQDMLNLSSKLENDIETIVGKNNHATEIITAQKGKKVFSLLIRTAKYPITFIIFENNIKTKIVNSTQTYLAVITEGLIQLMKKLVFTGNESVEINVVVGLRKDTTIPVTTSITEGYISLDEYLTRLNEKIVLEKAKLHKDIFKKSDIRITLSNDKRNTYLIFCDYICNFWYTKPARAFDGTIMTNGREVSIRDTLDTLYDREFVFPLFNTEENEHVIRMIQEGFYSDALFECLAGVLSENNKNLIEKGFLRLKPKQIHTQLLGLSEQIGNLMEFGESSKLTCDVLNKADELYLYLKKQGIEDTQFYMDIHLYRLAYLNNCGLLKEMEEEFNRLESIIGKYTAQTLNTDYLFVFYTRWAVCLYDQKRYMESIDVCENMELFLQMIEEAVKSNGFLKLEGEPKSEILGKILGTKLQSQIPLVYSDDYEYKSAVETSDRAIEQFTFWIDLKRQYQYRAELEAVAGNKKEAYEWLRKSFGGREWREYLSSPDKGIYDIYNLLFVSAFVMDPDKETIVMTDYIYKNCYKDIEASETLCDICVLLIGFIFLTDSNYEVRGRKLLEKHKNKIHANDVLKIEGIFDGLLNGEKKLDRLFYDKND